MKRNSTIRRRSQGFALVVTLSLMILLTILAVGLLSLSSVSLRSSGQGNAMATARANARLAMMLALGDLQKHAGPDQRVTARADLVAAAANPLYTGVWDSKPDPLSPNAPLDKTTPLVWLVSGNNATGLATTPLVSAANGGTEVRAPLQVVKATATSQPTGAYAYWVADEGVKACINLDSPGYRTTATATDAARAFAGAPRSAIDLMETAVNPATGTVSSAWGSALYPYVAETIPKLVTPGQLPLYTTAGNQAATQAATKSRFHDLTAYSSSVLADTANGGLRQDLTRILSDPTKGPLDADPIFPADSSVSPTPTLPHLLPPIWGRLRAWWNNPVDPATGSLTPALGTATTPPIAPVVMWAEVGFAFITENLRTATPPGTGYRLRIQAFPRAILWNPYTVPMAGRTYELGIGSYGVSGDAYISIQDAAGTEIKKFFLKRFSFRSDYPTRYLRFKIAVPTLKPGQSRVLSLATIMGDATLKEGDNPGNYTILNSSDDDWWDTPLEPHHFTHAINPLTGANAGFGGNTSFYLRDTNEAEPVNIPSKSFQYASPNSVSQTQGITGYPNGPLSLPATGTYAPAPKLRVVSQPQMDYRSPVQWFSQLNPLAPIEIRHSTDGTWCPFYGSNISAPSSTILMSVANDDASISTKLNNPSRMMDSSGNPYRLVLREPRLADSGLYQSIAHLQHAPLCDTGIGPLYVVGNSLKSTRIPLGTDTVNTNATGGNVYAGPIYDSSYLVNQALWDKYFFSTIPSTLSAADLASPAYKLPNSRLQPLPSADPVKLKKHDTAAANLMLLGGFNVNSTSEQAWRAVLGAAHNLKYDPVTGALAPTNPLQSPYSRFLKPLGDSAEPYRGYRQLTETQIAALAAKIVVEVKARGPFRSLADFVNRRLVSTPVPAVSPPDPAWKTGESGPVQAAIDAATGTNSTDRQILSIFGPGYLTQADVLSRIGSAISARSDTFVIRAYGEARTGGAVTAKAYCEAVVQRTPDYVDPATAPEALPAAGSINERFGRRFSIISFRWLSPNEI
jgi:hypothetical protein